jgi:hypothetical protein
MSTFPDACRTKTLPNVFAPPDIVVPNTSVPMSLSPVGWYPDGVPVKLYTTL